MNLFVHVDLPNPVTIVCYNLTYLTAFGLKLRPFTVKCCVWCGTQLYLHEKFLVILDTSVQVLLHLLMESLHRVFFQVSVFGISRVGIEIDFFAEFVFLLFKSVSNEKFLHLRGNHIYRVIYVYIYIYMCVCVYIYVYIYIYTQRETFFWRLIR